MRMVAVSATLPNIAEIASFLDANEAHVFDESYRPVPLTVHVIGQGHVSDARNSQFRFWAGLDRNVPEIIRRFSKKKPTIVFCHSKADTEKLADQLAMEQGIGFRCSSNSEIAGRTRVTRLQRALFHGIGYHHAGLEVDDRRLVETSFKEGKLNVLCATSTLAMGVNLPAHLVVIKGTKAWRGGGSGYQDLDQASLLQMIGRSGRPGYDTSGTAVIMTDNGSKKMFEQLVCSGLNPAVSKLCTRIDEVINTEVSQGVITTIESALNWIKNTLFSIQLHADPSKFGLKAFSPEDRETQLLQICDDSIKRLQAIGALTGLGGGKVFALPASHIMSQHLVEQQAMRLFLELPHDAKQWHVIKALADVEGMHRPVRRSEKKTLKEIHKVMKYKLDGALSKVTIQNPSQKAFVLLQASIGRIDIEDYTLRQEMNSMVDFSSRMLAALEEYSVRGTKNGNIVLQSLKLRRAFATSCWNADGGVLSQLKGVGPITTFSLKLCGISTFGDVLKSSDEEIEKAAKRLPPFGANLRSAVARILKDTLSMSARVECIASSSFPIYVVCELKKTPVIQLSDSISMKSVTPEVTYTLIAYTDQPGGCLIYRRNVSGPGCYKAQLPRTFGRLSFHLIASLVGLDGK